MGSQLLPQLKSLYRLVLRASSAAVRHHPTAKRTLRKLYRPVFEEAATFLSTFSSPANLTPSRDMKWFLNWNKRMDRTLLFLLKASTERGLEHRAIRNLTLLAHNRSLILQKRAKARPRWDPRMPPEIYEKISNRMPLSKTEKTQIGEGAIRMLKRDAAPLDEDADRVWNFLDWHIKLVEDSVGICLGQARFDDLGRLY